MISKEDADRLAADFVDYASPNSLFDDQLDRPASAPLRWIGADHRDDLDMLLVRQQPRGSLAGKFVEGALEAAFFVARANAADRRLARTRRSWDVDGCPTLVEELEDTDPLQNAGSDLAARAQVAELSPFVALQVNGAALGSGAKTLVHSQLGSRTGSAVNPIHFSWYRD